ncbi:MAG: hypothetical protein WCH99_12825 [Verrucomicrobiota bacterium]
MEAASSSAILERALRNISIPPISKNVAPIIGAALAENPASIIAVAPGISLPIMCASFLKPRCDISAFSPDCSRILFASVAETVITPMLSPSFFPAALVSSSSCLAAWASFSPSTPSWMRIFSVWSAESIILRSQFGW